MKAPTGKDWFYVAFLSILFLIILSASTVRRSNYYQRTDPDGALLTAQSILQYQTIKLDDWGHADSLKARYSYRVFQENGHTYYYFPLGTPLMAVPFVAVSQLAGMDMTQLSDELALQGWLVIVTVIAIALLSYRLCRFYLSEYESVLLTLLFTGGTSVASTCGTALWSFNFELVFILAAMILLVSFLKHPRPPGTVMPCLLGFCLFMAYLCRPSAAIYVVGVTIVLLLHQKHRIFGLTIATLFCLAGFFVLFNLREFGFAIPPYYQFNRLLLSGNFKTALYGHLLSPSRGFLVFSPHFIIVLIAGIIVFRHNRILAAFAYGWILMHLLTVSRFFHWWGGHGFGARLMTDIIPAVLLMAILLVSHLKTHASKHVKIGFFILLLVCGGISVAINTGQGLFNTSTVRWNFYPEIDPNPEYLFDWRYPQFLATPDNLEQRMQEHMRR